MLTDILLCLLSLGVALPITYWGVLGLDAALIALARRRRRPRT